MERGVKVYSAVRTCALSAGLVLAMTCLAFSQPTSVDLNLGGPTRFSSLRLPTDGLQGYDHSHGVVLRVGFDSMTILPRGRIEGLAHIEIADRSSDGSTLTWRPMFIAIPVVGSYHIKIVDVVRNYDLVTDGFDPGSLEKQATSQSFVLHGQVTNAAFTVKGAMHFVGQREDTNHTPSDNALLSGVDGFKTTTVIRANTYRGVGRRTLDTMNMVQASMDATNATIDNIWGSSISATGDAVVSEQGATYSGGSSHIYGYWWMNGSSKPGKIVVKGYNPTTGYRGTYVALLGTTQSQAIGIASSDGLAFPNVNDLKRLTTQSVFVAPGAALTKQVAVWPSDVYIPWLQD